MPAGERIVRMPRARWWPALLFAVAIGLGLVPSTGSLRAQSAPAPAAGPAGAVAVAAAPTAVAAKPVTVEASPVSNWTSLRYTTSKFLIFSGEVVMTKSAAGETVSVKTESRAKIFGSVLVDSWSVSTLDAATGRPLKFESVQPRKRIERWDFTGSRLQRWILKPPPDLPDTPMDKWAVTGSKTFPLPPAGAPAETPAPPVRSQWVYDYISMIAALRDLPLGKIGDATTVFIATSQGAVPMRISVGEERSGHRDLTDLGTGRSRRYDLRELRLRVTPVGGSRSETRGFLNMEGETELWIDAVTHTLTEISGSIPKVPGRVVITLVGYR